MPALPVLLATIACSTRFRPLVRLLESIIGHAQQKRLSCRGVCRAGGYQPDAEGNGDRSRGTQHRGIGDTTAQPFSRRDRPIGIAVGEDDQEFLPAIPSNRVTTAHGRSKSPSDFDET